MAGTPPRKPNPRPGAPQRGTQARKRPQLPRRVGTDQPPPRPQTEPAPRKKEPTRIEELIPVLIRHALKDDDGLTVARFNEVFLPRVKAVVPSSLRHMREDVARQYLLDMAHAVYLAIITGSFSARPALCGVRAAELAADLSERVLSEFDLREDRRQQARHCRNLLAGLTMYAIRFIESASLGGQNLEGFTERYERAVRTIQGLRTQAEAASAAPWASQPGNPLEWRINRAIQGMSTAFGDYIGAHGQTMDERQYELVMREFDRFMRSFAPIIDDAGPAAGHQRRAPGASAIHQPVVEPLTVEAIKPRPAGVEIQLADGRVLFLSTHDARRIGKSSEHGADEG